MSPEHDALEVRCRDLRPKMQGGRLFCVAAPRVNALGYVALARCLPDQPVCVVQAKTYSAKRYAPVGDLYDQEEYELLARRYIEEARAIRTEAPWLLFGMCEGAHVGFEMARQLRASGDAVGLLVMLDTWPIENTSIYPLVILDSWLRRWRALAPSQRISWLGKNVKRAVGSISSRVSPTQADGSDKPSNDDVANARVRMRARVWPGPSFVPPIYWGPITVLRIRSQPFWRPRDPTLGWSTRTALPVATHVVPGRHETLLRHPNIETVARVLRSCIRAAQT